MSLPGRRPGPPEVTSIPTRPARATRLRTVVALALPTVVAIALGSIDLSGRSLWIDESATFAIASQHGSALFAAMRRDGGNMLAYYALMHVLLVAFGRSTVVLRLPSVLASGLTAATVTLIAKRFLSLLAASAAGVISAVSLPIVYWGQDARAYSFMFAFTSLSYLGFVAILDRGGRHSDRPPRWAWPLYVLALVAAMYMSFIALLVVPAQLVSLYWRRRHLRSVAGALVVTALCGIPILFLARSRGSGQLFWVPRPNAGSTGEVVQALTGAGFSPDFHMTSSSLPLLSLTLAALVLAAGLAWRRSRASRDEGPSRATWGCALLAAWLVVPALIDGLESLVGQSVFESRYLLISAPAVAIALAWLLCDGGLSRPAGLAGLGLLIGLRAWQVAPSYGVSPENWKAATAYVLAGSRSGDCIAFYPEDGRQATDYYIETRVGARSTPLPRPVLPRAPFSEVRPYLEQYATLTGKELTRVASSCGRVWLLASHIGVPGATPESTVHRGRFDALVARIGHDYPARRVVRFGYASPVAVFLFSR